MGELVQLPVLTLACLIRERRVTAIEVMQAHLAHIAERNAIINAVVAMADPDAAVEPNAPITWRCIDPKMVVDLGRPRHSERPLALG